MASRFIHSSAFNFPNYPLEMNYSICEKLAACISPVCPWDSAPSQTLSADSRLWVRASLFAEEGIYYYSGQSSKRTALAGGGRAGPRHITAIPAKGATSCSASILKSAGVALDAVLSSRLIGF